MQVNLKHGNAESDKYAKTPLNVYKGLIAPIKTDSLIDARFFHVY